MRHIRLVVRHNPADPADDLKQVARLKRDLWSHSRVDIDPENPFCRTQRGGDRNVYFEFPTESPDQVRQMLQQHGHEPRVTMEDRGEIGLVCANCGYFADYVTLCPNCHHRDIDPCPHCGREVARERYEFVSGDLFVCPECHYQVRLQINPDLCNSDGTFNEPMVLVEVAQA